MQSWEEDDTFLSRWLNGELSEEEKAAFENSPEGREFKDLIIASRALKTPAYDTQKEFASLKTKLNKQSEPKVVRMTPMFNSLLAAASVLFFVAVYFIFWSGGTTIQTSYGEQQAVWLPDSSKVTLFSNSTLSYAASDWPEARKLKLEGEAFFEVLPGGSFEVNTENGTVNVLGTSFNLKARNARLDVICYSGQVSVAQASTREIINAGERIQLENGQILSQGKHAESAPLWLQSKSKFENVSLQEVLDELKNIYGFEITYDTLPDVKYSGTLPHDDAALAIKLLMEPLQIPYEYDASANVLSLNP